MVVPKFEIGPYRIDDDSKPIFLAEVGTLFGQDSGLAVKMIENVARARDTVPALPLMLKGEVLHDPEICLDDETEEAYQSKFGERRSERYRELIERKVLSLEAYAKIWARCHDLGLHMVMSVYDYEGADFAISEGVSGLKTNSGNMNNHPLIRYVAGLGVPMIIDTGRSALGEVETAVLLARREGNDNILVQHSPDGHPAPPENHNLRSLQTIRSAFDVPVGLSCHSAGTDMMILSLGLGAKLIEKPVAFDDTQLEQDYALSANLADLPQILERLDIASTALGRPFRDPGNVSGLISTSGRKGLVARRDLQPGDLITEDTVRFSFPCKGIRVDRYYEVENWHVRNPIAAGTPVHWGDVEP